MARLPVELLDNIIDLAFAAGIISVNDATLVCGHWKRRYQKLLFKSVKLDPFDESIPDLGAPDHNHLIPAIEELRVVPRSDSSSPSDYDSDVSVSFSNFLRNAQNVSSMVFGDSRIQWENVTPESITAFCVVFQRPSFRSLEVSVNNPLPSWMLLGGARVAHNLTVHRIGPITVPQPEPVESVPQLSELTSYQCSLTRLMLFGNASVKPMAEFCLLQRDLTKVLLKNVNCLVIEYDQTYVSAGPAITPYAEIMVALLAPQLEFLEICVESSDIPPSHISNSALQSLKALQHLTIHVAGCSVGYGDTLIFVKAYMASVFGGIPSSSPIKSLSLRVNDQRELDPEADGYYHDLVLYIYGELSCPEKWPRSTSADILVNVHDGNFTKPIQKSKTISMRANRLEIVSLFQVNVSGGSEPPQMA